MRTDRLLTEHLSTQGKPDPRGGLHSNVQNNLTPFSFDTLTIVENGLEMRKLWPPKVKGVKNSKNKPPNIRKVSSRTPKKFLVCCSIAIRVQRLALL
jgi:hypothetical protein